MRRAAILLGLSLLVSPGVTAQPSDAPVRYDGDYPSSDFHRGRRAAVLDALPANAVAVVLSAPERPRSNDVSFEYRQSSDFLYLTGSHESGSVLLLAPGGLDVDGTRVRELLLVPPRDPYQEVWLGRRFGADRAEELLGVEKAIEATRYDEIVGPLLARDDLRVFHLPLPDGVPGGTPLAAQVETLTAGVRSLDVDQGGLVGFVLGAMLSVRSERAYAGAQDAARRGFRPDAVADPDLRAAAEAFVASTSLSEWMAERDRILSGYADAFTLRTVLNGLRAIKTEEELALLQRAIDITAEAHTAVMQQVEPGWAEYQIEALVEYTFKREGAEHPGFPSIVGSGENSVILHYETNRRVTRPGDVVVIDVGAEYHGYSADVTRTIPVDGVFSEEQRAIYDIVHRAQQAGIDVALAGSEFNGPHFEAQRVLAAGLADLGLITDPTDRQGLGRFFMHGTSHYLGLDVHDVGTGEPLEPGTVITVEPGIYIPEAPDIDPRWWNIGIRIEDDVLVTEGAPVILSAGLPRRADRIESLMRRRPAS